MAEYTGINDQNSYSLGTYEYNDIPEKETGIECLYVSTKDNASDRYHYSGNQGFTDLFNINYVETDVPFKDSVFGLNNIENGILFNTSIPTKDLPVWMIPYKDYQMYRVSDKLPFIGTFYSVNNVVIPEATIIMMGINNKALLESRTDGIAAGFLPIDTYNDAMLISKNYLVYTFISMTQRYVYVYDFIMQRATKANATYRQIHRKFV